MIRVLAFSDVVLPEGAGGVERQIVEIYTRLASAGLAEVHLVSLAPHRAPTEDVVPGFSIHRVPRISLVRSTGAQVAFSFKAWTAAAREFRDFRPDVIHANTLFYGTSLTAAWMSVRHRTPLVLTAHIGDVSSLPQPYRTLSSAYEQTVGRALLKRSTFVICIGESVKAHVVNLGGRPGRCVIVPNGVDASKFTPGGRVTGSPRPVLVSVGRLIFNKGNQYLISAAKLLRQRGYEFELWIVGDGPMEAQTRRMGAELIKSGHLKMLGRRDDVPEILRQADIFVRPSLTESMPMGVLEAMASGLAVIASDAGSTGEALREGVDGLLVKPGDVPGLERALATLLNDPARRDALGRSARQRALKFSWELAAERTGEVLQTAARVARR